MPRKTQKEVIRELKDEVERLRPFEAYFTCIAVGEVPVKLTARSEKSDTSEPTSLSIELIGLRRAHGGLIVFMHEYSGRPRDVRFLEPWLSEMKNDRPVGLYAGLRKELYYQAEKTYRAAHA